MLIYIHGQNTLLIKEKIKAFKDKFVRDVDKSGNNIISFYGRDFSVDELSNALFTMSLFSAKRMIILRNMLGERKTEEELVGIVELFSRLKDKNNNIIIVVEDKKFDKKRTKKNAPIFHKILDVLKSAPYVFECKELNSLQKRVWIQKKVQLSGLNITNQTADYLSLIVGADMWMLDNELKKLINYSLAKSYKEIHIQDIKKLVKNNTEEKIFTFLDALCAQDCKRTISVLERFLSQGMDPLYIFSMIVWQFRQLLQISSSYEEQKNTNAIDLAKYLKMHPFVVQKNLALCRKYSLDSLKAVYKRLLEIDMQTKTGQIKPALVLEMFSFRPV